MKLSYKVFILIAIVVLIIIGALVYFGMTSNINEPIKNDTKPSGLFCTQEAKQCPDGSYVSRDSGLNCEFRACP